MAEQLEKQTTRSEQLPVGNDAAKYVHPYSGYYMPPPYQTYTIPRQHHYPLEHARQSVSHAFGAFSHDALHPWGDNYPLKTPHCDVRESKTAYYIDVEIPGLESKANVTLKWTNTNTLFIEAVTKRLPTPEDGTPDAIHIVQAERKIGTYARAFTFPIAVSQDETSAKLAYGVVRLTVPKQAKAQSEHKVVEVEHEGH
jgi:HSP20 family protein